MYRHTTKGKLAVAVVLAMQAALAAGADGTLLINQDCALNGGCFSGDSSGFPVTITASGSYRLAGNLDVDVSAVPSPSSTTAIEVQTDRVTIDLNGFTISGPVVCSGGPPVTSCANSGSSGADGVFATSGSDMTTVRDGHIVGMGEEGIQLNAGARVDGVTVRSNGGVGIQSGANSVVRDVNVLFNGNFGVLLENNTLLSGSAVIGNMQGGVLASKSLVARDNTVRANGGRGFSTDRDAVLADNVVTSNGGIGLFVFNSGSVVAGNVAKDNAGAGLDCSGFGKHSAYGRNTLRGNNSGGAQVSGRCLEVDSNICGTNTTCP